MQNGAHTADELVQPVSVCPLHVSTEDYVSSTVLQKLKGQNPGCVCNILGTPLCFCVGMAVVLLQT